MERRLEKVNIDSVSHVVRRWNLGVVKERKSGGKMTMTTENCSVLVGKKKAGLLKDTPSRIGRVLKKNKIKDSDNSTRKRKV